MESFMSNDEKLRRWRRVSMSRKFAFRHRDGNGGCRCAKPENRGYTAEGRERQRRGARFDLEASINEAVNVVAIRGGG